MASPYANLPAKAFWRSGVTDRAPLDPGEIYSPRFPIKKDMRIATAGSCFAQHVGRTLAQAGFNVLDTEPAHAGVSDKTAQAYGYRLYSARYGNIYTAPQLLQLLREAQQEIRPALPVWEKNGRFYDAQRPGVEPDGLATRELVLEHRKAHLRAVRNAFFRADLVVFTFGLTEAWIHTDSGTVYPTAPSTIAGRFDRKVFSFKNYGFEETLEAFVAVRELLMAVNPDVQFMITVSPVPLTATATGQHVEVATSYSKSVLRAVCGTLFERFANVDYFPSYEIITSQNARGAYYEANKRSVSAQGVATAMRTFVTAHGYPAPGQQAAGDAASAGQPDEAADLVCEEQFLEAFAK